MNTNLFNTTLLNGGAAVAPTPTLDTITFNGFSFTGAEIIVSDFEDDSAAKNNLVTRDIPRDDGFYTESNFYKAKIITVKGTIWKNSRLLLQQALDEMKKFLNVIDGTLTIDRDGEIRNYTATVQNMGSIFAARKGNFVTFSPFTVQFACKPFSVPAARDIVTDTISSSPFSSSLYNAGSGKSKSQITFNFTAAVGVTSFNFRNDTNGQEIQVVQAFTAGDILIFDGEAGLVTVNGLQVNSDGFYPEIETGSNLYTVTVAGTSFSGTMTTKFFKNYL